MVGKTFASVWDAIAETPQEAENMKIRAALMRAIKARIDGEKWTQSEAAKRLGVTQPRVSDLVRGKIGIFSVDTLLAMAANAGLAVEVKIKRAA